MNARIAAEQLLSNPRFRFTIREIGRGDLRKLMTVERYLLKRDQYAGRTGIRVDVLDTVSGGVQTWDLYLTKWFAA